MIKNNNFKLVLILCLVTLKSFGGGVLSSCKSNHSELDKLRGHLASLSLDFTLHPKKCCRGERLEFKSRCLLDGKKPIVFKESVALDASKIMYLSLNEEDFNKNIHTLSFSLLSMREYLLKNGNSLSLDFNVLKSRASGGLRLDYSYHGAKPEIIEIKSGVRSLMFLGVLCIYPSNINNILQRESLVQPSGGEEEEKGEEA